MKYLAMLLIGLLLTSELFWFFLINCIAYLLAVVIVLIVSIVLFVLGSWFSNLL